jgi:hypothetical protein
MSDDGQRSGISPWLVGLIGYGLYRRGQRRGRQEDRSRGRRRGAVAPTDLPLRDVRLPDGRDVLQVTASLFEPDPGSPEVWRRVVLDGAAAVQDALELTVEEVAREGIDASTGDVPMVLVPIGARRRVHAVEVYATGGRVGWLPADAVRAVGDSLQRTHLAIGRPCAVPGRIQRHGPAARRVAEVLLPEVFEPGDDA